VTGECLKAYAVVFADEVVRQLGDIRQLILRIRVSQRHYMMLTDSTHHPGLAMVSPQETCHQETSLVQWPQQEIGELSRLIAHRGKRKGRH
jgi:hypothetical protein